MSDGQHEFRLRCGECAEIWKVATLPMRASTFARALGRATVEGRVRVTCKACGGFIGWEG